MKFWVVLSCCPPRWRYGYGYGYGYGCVGPQFYLLEASGWV